MAEDAVLVKVDKRGVAMVTLNRPKLKNAYNGEMIRLLNESIPKLENRGDVRVIVFRGTGRYFQAGADLGWLTDVAGQSDDVNMDVSRQTENLVRNLDLCPKPTVAVVQGGCIGGGTGLLAACDVVVAAEDAQFAVSEVRWGLVPHPILPQLNAAMGARNTRRYALTAEKFTAERAREMGLVHEVVPNLQLERTAERVIDSLLRNGPEAVRLTKEATLRLAETEVGAATAEALARAHSDKRQSAEAMEGLASFRGKRSPQWYRDVAG